ncbi:TetR/AcrR family transcriptional regulator [Crossiella sp. SN42]|uniref:TetR/AcrR family transcriptional regulator n=1 Tax=Crossiella sp. SN42 TaxID=2944808 RepID=UPI00207CD216|nr:TetR/AcrR family transcriptional regulator [Crossiella sp. SN42]MCO1577252.1 TetR/AcrR family transcriptional regulator [Crossiella sp. SN42]
MADPATAERKPGGMSEQRRQRIRLEISREAARLFWEHGVDNTTGEQIAEAVGLSVRTIWRHFRSKEACAEPVVAHSVETFVRMLRDWPPHRSMEQQLAHQVGDRYRQDPFYQADDVAAMKMIVLGMTEPALRTAWLMACDQAEAELIEIIADRLKRPKQDLELRLHVAAAGAALRVINEDVSRAYLAGTPLTELSNPFGQIARAMRRATGGVIGDPVA